MATGLRRYKHKMHMFGLENCFKMIDQTSPTRGELEFYLQVHSRISRHISYACGEMKDCTS